MRDRLYRAAGWLPIAVAAAVSAFCVYRIAALPAQDLVGYVADDAFYYLVVAKNLAASGRLTFDGINTASGVHPAWVGLLTLLASTGLSDLPFVRGAIALAYGCHVAAALLIVRALRVAGATAGHARWAGALWLVNPIALVLVVEAMEAPLVIAALVASCLGMQHALERDPRASRPLWMASGLLALLCLARTDGALAAALGALALAVMCRRTGGSRRAAVRTAVIVMLLPALAIGGFSLWLYTQTGYPTQSSAEIKLLWASAATIPERLSLFADVSMSFGARGASMLGLPMRLSWMMGALLFGACMTGAVLSWRKGESSRALLTLWLLSVAVVSTGVYTLALYTYQSWYTALPIVAGFLALALEAARSLPGRAWAVAGAALLAMMTRQDVLLLRAGAGPNDLGPASYAWVASFDSAVPLGEPIGAFDAGTLGFFSRHRIVNLDGMVNDAVRPHWKAGTLDAYIMAEGVRFIVSDPRILEQLRAFTRLPELDLMTCQTVADSSRWYFCLWRVR